MIETKQQALEAPRVFLIKLIPKTQTVDLWIGITQRPQGLSQWGHLGGKGLALIELKFDQITSFQPSQPCSNHYKLHQNEPLQIILLHTTLGDSISENPLHTNS